MRKTTVISSWLTSEIGNIWQASTHFKGKVFGNTCVLSSTVTLRNRLSSKEIVSWEFTWARLDSLLSRASDYLELRSSLIIGNTAIGSSKGSVIQTSAGCESEVSYNIVFRSCAIAIKGYYLSSNSLVNENSNRGACLIYSNLNHWCNIWSHISAATDLLARINWAGKNWNLWEELASINATVAFSTIAEAKIWSGECQVSSKHVVWSQATAVPWLVAISSWVEVITGAWTILGLDGSIGRALKDWNLKSFLS